MTKLPTIKGSDFASRIREVFDLVRHGQPTVVRQEGKDQVVLLDVLDFELLQAAARCRVKVSGPLGSVSEAVQAYLEEKISLGKAAQLLGVSRFELVQRFHRLGIPMSLGPATLDEAQREVETALRFDER